MPLPTFPLSSPITEEISSPSCSSAEERELERNRPFDFLVKATRQKLTNKPGKDESRSPLSPVCTHRDRIGDTSRLITRGISKRRKNAGRPVGLNLVTDFTLAPPPKKRVNDNTTAPFVDLNDLKQLCKAREKERSAQRAKTPFKKSTSQSEYQISSEIKQPAESTIESQNGNPFLDPSVQNPFSDKTDHGLSPSDRHVMIGLTVPCDESVERSKEFDSAGDLHTPLTPSIIVTPAREDAPWSTTSPGTGRVRPTSSVYSQPTPRPWEESDIPPVPAIPAQHTASTKQAQLDSDFLSAHFAAATQERRRRFISAETIIEDDSPEQERSGSMPDLDDDRAPLNRLSVNTEASRPQSQGWWTYLLSPLLGKKSPLSPNFPRGQLSSPESATTGTDAKKEWWKKEVSCFSPETPATTMTEWWNDDDKRSVEQTRSVDNQDETAVTETVSAIDTENEVQPMPNRNRNTTVSMFGGRPIQGEAAEYYQACAHELFSKTPYFECFNHICSITPASVIDQLYAEAGETRDRGLILAEAGIPGSARLEDGANADDGTTRDLLVGVDQSVEENAKQAGQKRAPSTTSSSSSSGRSLTEVDNHEKGLPEPPQSGTKEVVPMPEPEATPAPAPVFQEPIQAPIEVPGEQAPVPPQIVNNVHYAPPPVAAPAEHTVTVERAVPHYIPIFPPQHDVPGPQPAPDDKEFSAMPVEHPQQSEWPWKASSQSQERSIGSDVATDQRASREASPISPGFQNVAGGPGSIPLSEVHAPAPAYTQYPRDAPLPPRYDLHPAPGAAVMDPGGLPGPGEARRRRLEREDAVGRRVGGLWRGRGCFSNKGCFGRPGREGRLRRRWYVAICTFFLIIVVLAIALATTLTKHGDGTLVQSDWLNLTGYPPMPTGIATIAGAETQVAKSSCIKPATLWSCALPQEQQSANKPYAANSPSFRVAIRFRNGTYDNSTGTVSATPRNTRRSDNSLWAANPAAPRIEEQTFLGNTTDGNATPYAGEETPFYMSILSPVPLSSTNLYRRSSSSNLFPNLTTVIPPPETNPDGRAAAATLYPFPDSQPIRLYNRGQPNEHYGFYTYFDKSIFLSSRSPLDGGKTDPSPNDTNGGVARSSAQVRCTWSQTRFLVQIWTNPSRMGYSLLSPSLTSSAVPTPTSESASTPTSTIDSTSSATDFTRPGSFPYPVTITLDRHGGSEKKKLVYCYAIGDDGHYNVTDVKLQVEDRAAGGTLVNPASGIFENLDDSSASGDGADGYGGIDGGNGGCQCKWVNWIQTV